MRAAIPILPLHDASPVFAIDDPALKIDAVVADAIADRLCDNERHDPEDDADDQQDDDDPLLGPLVLHDFIDDRDDEEERGDQSEPDDLFRMTAEPRLFGR